MREDSDISSKRAFVMQNIQKLPQIYQKDAELTTADSNTSSIKLQTFYKALQPLSHSYKFQMPHDQVEYPVATIVAYPHTDQAYYSVELQFSIWVESGGLRCIPLKYDANEKDIAKYSSLSHCLVVPDWGQCEPKSATEFIPKIIQAYRNMPVLFMGRAAATALQLLAQITSDEGDTGTSEIFIPHSSFLLRDLQLSHRLALQNRKKIAFPVARIDPNSLKRTPQFQVAGTQVRRNGEQVASIIENQEEQLIFILHNTSTFDNPDSINLWHKAIVNFVDLARSKPKPVNQKQVERLLLHHHKLSLKGDGSAQHYQVS